MLRVQRSNLTRRDQEDFATGEAVWLAWHACSPAFTAPECPPGTSGRRATTVPWWMIAGLIGFLVLVIIAAILAPAPARKSASEEK